MDSLLIDFTKIVKDAEQGSFDELKNVLEKALAENTRISEILHMENGETLRVSIPRTYEKLPFYFLESRESHRLLMKKMVHYKRLDILRLLYKYNKDFIDWVIFMNENALTYKGEEYIEFRKQIDDVMREFLSS